MWIRQLIYFSSRPHQYQQSYTRTSLRALSIPWPHFSIRAVRLSSCVPASFFRDSVVSDSLYRLSIIYDFRPQLRSRLTLGGRTFPRKPQTLDGEVSRLPLATYAGILSSISSTAPFGTASANIHRSSTNTLTRIPKLRRQVLAPIIFRAPPLDQ